MHRIVQVFNNALGGKMYCSAAFVDIYQASDRLWHQRKIYKPFWLHSWMHRQICFPSNWAYLKGLSWDGCYIFYVQPTYRQPEHTHSNFFKRHGNTSVPWMPQDCHITSISDTSGKEIETNVTKSAYVTFTLKKYLLPTRFIWQLHTTAGKSVGLRTWTFASTDDSHGQKVYSLR